MKRPSRLAALVSLAFILLGCSDPEGVCVRKSECRGPLLESSCRKDGGEFHALQAHQQSNTMLGAQSACSDVGYKKCGGVGTLTCKQ